MGQFGWDLPPGVTVQDIEEAQEGDATMARFNELDYGPREEPDDPLQVALENLIEAVQDGDAYYGNAMDAVTRALHEQIADQAQHEAQMLLARAGILFCGECGRLRDGALCSWCESARRVEIEEGYRVYGV